MEKAFASKYSGQLPTITLYLVGDRVLETLRLAALELKSSVSTYSTNPAYRGSVYNDGFLKVWLRQLDSNQRIRESKSLALPLGYTPIYKPLYSSNLRQQVRFTRIQEAIMNINFGLHSQRKGGFKLMHYQPHIRCNIAYTPWPSAYCPPLTSITSAILHLFCPSCYPTFSRTRTRAISFSLRIVGQSFQPPTRRIIISPMN